MHSFVQKKPKIAPQNFVLTIEKRTSVQIRKMLKMALKSAYSREDASLKSWILFQTPSSTNRARKCTN
jgi:hypothetical protein